jgi:hypothetical protein
MVGHLFEMLWKPFDSTYFFYFALHLPFSDPWQRSSMLMISERQWPRQLEMLGKIHICETKYAKHTRRWGSNHNSSKEILTSLHGSKIRWRLGRHRQSVLWKLRKTIRFTEIWPRYGWNKPGQGKAENITVLSIRLTKSCHHWLPATETAQSVATNITNGGNGIRSRLKVATKAMDGFVWWFKSYEKPSRTTSMARMAALSTFLCLLPRRAWPATSTLFSHAARSFVI